MRCPNCGDEAAVAEEAEQAGAVRRRRRCAACGRAFVTWERPESSRPLVVKRDGRREDFSRQKLVRSVALACAKRPLALEAIAERVEARLAAAGEAEVASERIGELVLEELRGLDDVAYLRYASGFHRFADASAFVEAAEALREWRRRSAETRWQLALDFDADQPHWN